MNRLLMSSQTLVDMIPIGRRIYEIMKEKGPAFSQQAVAQRLGYSAETLRMMVNGKRDIHPFELEKISGLLKVPLDRLLQNDILDLANEYQELRKSFANPERALELALKLNSVAIGMTERCRSQHQLGEAYCNLKQFDDAHLSLLEAKTLAQTLNEKYGESDHLYKVLLTLVVSSTAKKEYSKTIEIIKSVESIFSTSPQRLAALNYIRADMAASLGDLNGARGYSYESLGFSRITGKPILIGRAQINTAHYEYLFREFTKSKELLENAIPNLVDDNKTRYIAIKELVKTFIKLDELSLAYDMISENVHKVAEHNFTDLEGKYWILLSRITNDPQYANRIIEQEKYGQKIRILAGKYLCSLYKKNNDSQMFMHYHVITEELGGSSSDILDEEGM